jgi:hypothetical protein
VEHTGRKRNAFRLLVVTPKGKKPFAILTCGMEENIKVRHKEIGRKGVDWSNLVQNGEKIWALVKNMVTSVAKLNKSSAQ